MTAISSPLLVAEAGKLPVPIAPEVSVVMPCLNEAETLRTCIEKALRAFRETQIDGEVVVADNGSTDGSPELARSCGARVVHVESRGYGAALTGGIDAARGKYVIMGDADDSYDFGDLPVFLQQLRAGFDLVMGNRFKGGIKPGAMPALHRYLGNPVLTRIGRLFFKSPCGDFHCGLRGFSRVAWQTMGLRTSGMEFASEMVVRATLLGMRITEVPTTLSPDGRSHRPHLRTWRDGWRHLHFLLSYSPRWLFFYPGMLLMVIGVLAATLALSGPHHFGNVLLDHGSVLCAPLALLLAVQAIGFAVFTNIFAISEGLLPRNKRFSSVLRFLTPEVGLLFGLALVLWGVGGSFIRARTLQLGSLDYAATQQILQSLMPYILLLSLGVQAILSSFFVSVLPLKAVLAESELSEVVQDAPSEHSLLQSTGS